MKKFSEIIDRVLERIDSMTPEEQEEFERAQKERFRSTPGFEKETMGWYVVGGAQDVLRGELAGQFEYSARSSEEVFTECEFIEETDIFNGGTSIPYTANDDTPFAA